jgi:hypothetical protein
MLHCKRQQSSLGFTWVAASVIETRIAVLGNRSGKLRFPPSRARPQARSLDRRTCNHTSKTSGCGDCSALPDDTLELAEARLVNCIHDEPVLEVPEADAERVTPILERVVCEGFLRMFPSAAAMTADLVEARTGRNWQETESQPCLKATK